MAEADPGLKWHERRRRVARETQRRSVAHAAAGTTDMADGPFANLASVYTDPERLAAEKARLEKAIATAVKERDALAGRLNSPGFSEKAKPEAVEKARDDHAARSAEADRLGAALARLG